MKTKLLQGNFFTIRMLTAWQQPGFSLVEMAVVLVIVGTLLGGMMMPLSIQMEQQKIAETRKTLEMAKEALLVYAAANGRLPCPASLTSNGAEEFFGGGNASIGVCSHPLDGYLPAVTLGLSPVDSQGYAVDGWGVAKNRIRYVVSDGAAGGVTNVFTKSNGMRSAGMTAIAATTSFLTICRTNSVAVDCGGASNLFTQQAPAIVYSLGKNAATGGTGLDEAQNLDANTIFVSHEMSSNNPTNGEFDDMLNWISLNSLFGRMMTAGSLP